MRAIFLVQGIKPKVAVAFQAMVKLLPWGNGCKEGTGYFPKTVEEAVVRGVNKSLLFKFEGASSAFLPDRQPAMAVSKLQNLSQLRISNTYRTESNHQKTQSHSRERQMGNDGLDDHGR